MSKQNERAAFIEETGLLFEQLGTTRMTGRILGFLMVTDKEMVAFDEITEVLQASKSSISTNLKSLVQIGYVKPLTLPGNRKTYYMLSPDMQWGQYFEQRLQLLRVMNGLFKKALDLRVSKNDQPARWLQESVSFYDWIIEAFPDLMKRWEEEQKKHS